MSDHVSPVRSSGPVHPWQRRPADDRFAFRHVCRAVVLPLTFLVVLGGALVIRAAGAPWASVLLAQRLDGRAPTTPTVLGGGAR